MQDSMGMPAFFLHFGNLSSPTLNLLFEFRLEICFGGLNVCAPLGFRIYCH